MRHLLLIPIAMLSLLLGACTDDKSDSNIPSLTINQVIEVSDNGGIYSLAYSVSNPLNDITPLVLTDAEWITDVAYPFEGIISFRALGNPTSEPREALLTIKYPGVENPAEVTVKQGGSIGVKLTMDISTEDYSTIETTITPVDEELVYITMLAEKEYFASMDITDEESLTRNDIAYFKSYLGDTDSMEDFLRRSNIAASGTSTRKWEMLSPSTEYVVYGYCIAFTDESYVRTSPVYHHIVGSRLPQRIDIDFGFEVETDGPETTLHITPEGWDGYYMLQLVKEGEQGFIAENEPKGEEFVTAVAESFFYVADNMYYLNGYTPEQIMSKLGHRGETTYSETLSADSKYMAILYAIATEDEMVPMMVSNPVVNYFTTGSVARSDLQFEVHITDIMPRTANIEIIPSNLKESYTAVVMYAENMPEGDNATQLAYVMENYYPFVLTGRYSERVTNLTPDCEFILAIYGIYADAPTTDLFVYRFTTKAEGVGTNRITNVQWSAYDLYEVIDIEDYYYNMLGTGDYFLSMEVTTAEPTQRVHFSVYRDDQFEELGPEGVRADLLDYSYNTLFDWSLCYYGNTYIICGFAEDENGYLGELYISEPITVKQGETSNPQDFVDRYKDYTE